MRLRILPPAREEIREAFDFFEARSPGLGHRFSRELAEAIEKVTESPLTWPRLDDETRKCSLRRFKYGVLYQLDANEIVVVAIMDLRRRPGYWRHRR